MRMIHYYLALAIFAPPALLATAYTGATFDGSGHHFALGLSTAIFCIALNTLTILFMLVTARVVRQAMASRQLGASFLAEANDFFAHKRGYPVAIFGSFFAALTAVLGYGKLIGIPTPVHIFFGVGTVIFELWALLEGFRVLKGNQDLLDRVTVELNRMDELGMPVDESAVEPHWRLDLRGRWFAFAVASWAPYLYWSLIVWDGDFGKISHLFPALSAAVSLVGIVNGARTPRGTSPEVDD